MNMKMVRFAFRITLLAAVVSGMAGCENMAEVAEIGASVAAQHGHLSDEQADSLVRSAKKAEKSVEDLTPRQEHFLGRAVAAQILSRYPPYNDERVNRYLNELGQTLAAFSDRPETYGGYRFLALDEEAPNAFAAPGGFILVTRGLLERVDSEAALAGVLAHEINHVSKRHGLDAIRQERLNEALGILAAESLQQWGSEELVQLTEAFDGAVGDVTSKLINSGYSRAFEKAADVGAVAVLKRSGYGLGDYLALLRVMPEGNRDTPGFLSSHPHIGDRIDIVENSLDQAGSEPSGARIARFQSRINEPLGR